jgi:hypothetical protein
MQILLFKAPSLRAKRSNDEGNIRHCEERSDAAIPLREAADERAILRQPGMVTKMDCRVAFGSSQ